MLVVISHWCLCVQYCQFITLTHKVWTPNCANWFNQQRAWPPKRSIFAPQSTFARGGVGYPGPADCKTIHPQMFAEGGAESRVLLISHYWSFSYWLKQGLCADQIQEDVIGFFVILANTAKFFFSFAELLLCHVVTQGIFSEWRSPLKRERSIYGRLTPASSSSHGVLFIRRHASVWQHSCWFSNHVPAGLLVTTVPTQTGRVTQM